MGTIRWSLVSHHCLNAVLQISVHALACVSIVGRCFHITALNAVLPVSADMLACVSITLLSLTKELTREVENNPIEVRCQSNNSVTWFE
jgi:hypothetical protein